MTRSVLIQAIAFGLSASASPAQMAESVADLVLPLVESRDFAGTILIARGSDTVFLASYGDADVALGVPNRPDTPMRVGSISKQFTAAAVLLLEEDGKLAVTDPLARFVPGFPRGDDITLHHLLTHQSGIIRDVFAEWEERRGPRPLDVLVGEIARQSLDFEPGSETSYSNAGYTLLAHVVERTGGLPFASFLDRRVFGPLGMTRTEVWRPEAIVPGMATGYDPGPPPERLLHTPHEDPSNTLGADGVISTVGDLHQWSEALESDALLSSASRDKMLESYGAGRGYGIGVSTDGQRVGHDGVTHGFVAFLDRDLDADLTIAYTGNIRSGVLEGVRTALGAIARGQPYESITRPESSDGGVEGSLERYVGRYELFPGFVVEISREGDRLYLLGTGGYPTILEPLGDRSWFYRARYETIRFEETEGSVTGLTWIDRAGQTYPAARIDEPR